MGVGSYVDDILDNYSVMAGMAVQLDKRFACSKLQGTLAYATCLRRQATTCGKEPVYLDCTSQCKQGAKIRKMFPDYDMKAVKKMNSIALKPGNGREKEKRKSQVFRPKTVKDHEGKISAQKRRKVAESEPINLHNLELVLKSQVAYIMSLANDGRLKEAVRRLKMTAEAI